jgi:hypothetical protein
MATIDTDSTNPIMAFVDNVVSATSATFHSMIANFRSDAGQRNSAETGSAAGDAAESPPASHNSCQSCGLPWTEHKGIAATCGSLIELRRNMSLLHLFFSITLLDDDVEPSWENIEQAALQIQRQKANAKSNRESESVS